MDNDASVFRGLSVNVLPVYTGDFGECQDVLRIGRRCVGRRASVGPTDPTTAPMSIRATSVPTPDATTPDARIRPLTPPCYSSIMSHRITLAAVLAIIPLAFLMAAGCTNGIS